MGLMKSKYAVLILFALFGISQQKELYAQENYPISGYVIDSASGKALNGATLQVSDIDAGAVTDSNGYYMLYLPAGKYEIKTSFLSYQSRRDSVTLKQP